MMRFAGAVAVFVAYFVCGCSGRVYNYESDGGAIAGNSTLGACWRNGAIMNHTLALLQPGDELLVPSGVFYMMGGIMVSDKDSVVFRVEGTIKVCDDMKAWPRRGDGDNAQVLEVFHFLNMRNFTITSSSTTGERGELTGNDGAGVLDGQGSTWWGFPGIGYLEIGENRPRLLVIDTSTDVLVENIFLKNSPYWTFWAPSATNLEVRHSRISAYRISNTSHTLIDMTAFNTDGFDFTGQNIWIHNSTVWNQDDCFCVKDNTQDVVIEDVNASGLGLTIGSIASTVRNVTFRNAHMQKTVKGIYMKFRGAGLVEDVLYENIVIDEPEQYAIWVGPAQQSDDKTDPCAAHPCSLCWPFLPGAECNAPADAFYRNVTLRDIVVQAPSGDLGVVYANMTSQMQDIVFDNVVAYNVPSGKGWKICKGVETGYATGDTNPAPPCFTKETPSLSL